MDNRDSFTSRDWLAVGLRIALLIAIIGAAGALLASPLYALVLAAGLYLLVRWHNRTYDYRCRECGSVFSISMLTNFLSPHGPGIKGPPWKFLKCPECGRWNRAEVVKKAPGK